MESNCNKRFKFKFNGDDLIWGLEEVSKYFQCKGLSKVDGEPTEILESFQVSREFELLEDCKVIYEGKKSDHVVISKTDMIVMSNEDFEKTYIKNKPRQLGRYFMFGGQEDE